MQCTGCLGCCPHCQPPVGCRQSRATALVCISGFGLSLKFPAAVLLSCLLLLYACAVAVVLMLTAAAVLTTTACFLQAPQVMLSDADPLCLQTCLCLQLLSNNTRRTKVVELSTGTHRFAGQTAVGLQCMHGSYPMGTHRLAGQAVTAELQCSTPAATAKDGSHSLTVSSRSAHAAWLLLLLLLLLPHCCCCRPGSPTSSVSITCLMERVASTAPTSTATDTAMTISTSSLVRRMMMMMQDRLHPGPSSSVVQQAGGACCC